MKKTIYTLAFFLCTIGRFSLSAQLIISENKIVPNLTDKEYQLFLGDVKKFTRSYSSGLCAKFATAILHNVSKRNHSAFPYLELREGRLIQSRQGRNTYPLTTASTGIIYAKNYKHFFERHNDFVKIKKSEVTKISEKTIVIAVYQPKQKNLPGHIEVLFRRNNTLLAASDKLDKPLFNYKNQYNSVDFYYPKREI